MLFRKFQKLRRSRITPIINHLQDIQSILEIGNVYLVRKGGDVTAFLQPTAEEIGYN